MSHLMLPRVSRRRFMKGASAAALGISLLPLQKGWAAEEKKLYLYNWDTYIGEKTIPTFEDSSGIKVQVDYFGSNEELFGKIKAGNPGYDLIVPTDYILADMISLNMVTPLNHDKIPNISNLGTNPLFTDPWYNPGLKYGVPYMWGTVGIGFRKSKISEEEASSWSLLFKSTQHKGRLALLEDLRSTMSPALKLLGYSMNTTNEKEVLEARDLIIAQLPNIKTFAADNGQDLLLSREVDAALEYSGDIFQVSSEDDDIQYSIPKEGAQIWVDNMAIPKDAPHPENAHAFINHILNAEIGAEIADYIQYGSPNEAAKQYISKENLSNPSIYPPQEVLARCEPLRNLGDFTKFYDKVWTEIRAG